MQDDFRSLFAFNRWANAKMLDSCRKLTAEQYVAEPTPGWPSVRSTVVHIVVVLDFWLRKLEEDPDERLPGETELATIDDAERLLKRVYERFDKLLPSLTPERLVLPVTYTLPWLKVTAPPWVTLRHMVNHTTYHRGQVASKLKRFGIEQPITDFMFWWVEQTPQPK